MAEEKRQFETIFSADNDWQMNACLNWSHNPLELYAIGYKEAADKLVEHVLSEFRSQDVLIYPIAFLYRQYIELRLKEIIREGRILLEEGSTFPTHHKIEALWGTAKAVAVKAFEAEGKFPNFEYADHVIRELAAIDPLSFSFRYPNSKSGEISLDGVKYINIRRMAEHIQALSQELEGISLEISMYRDWQQDMCTW